MTYEILGSCDCMSHYYYTLDISFPFSGICLRGLECTCGSSVKASSFSCELKEFVFEAFLVLSCELEPLLVLFKCIVWTGLLTSDGPAAFCPWDHTVLLSSTCKLFTKSNHFFTIYLMWYSENYKYDSSINLQTYIVQIVVSTLHITHSLYICFYGVLKLKTDRAAQWW